MGAWQSSGPVATAVDEPDLILRESDGKGGRWGRDIYDGSPTRITINSSCTCLGIDNSEVHICILGDLDIT